LVDRAQLAHPHPHHHQARDRRNQVLVAKVHSRGKAGSDPVVQIDAAAPVAGVGDQARARARAKDRAKDRARDKISSRNRGQVTASKVVSKGPARDPAIVVVDAVVEDAAEADLRVHLPRER
jgi:hypothetical protein